MSSDFFRRLQVTCVIVLAAIRATAFAAKPIVVAGQSMGGVRLGFTRAQVHKALGKPDKTFKLKGGLSDDLWRAKTTSRDQDGQTIHHKLEVIYKAGKVIQIEATSPMFITASGLSTESTLRVLNKSLNPKRYYTYSYDDGGDSGYVRYYLDQVQSGIAFESPPHQDVWGGNKGSETLIIHRKGVPVIPDQGGKFESATDHVDAESLNANYR